MDVPLPTSRRTGCRSRKIGWAVSWGDASTWVSQWTIVSKALTARSRACAWDSLPYTASFSTTSSPCCVCVRRGERRTHASVIARVSKLSAEATIISGDDERYRSPTTTYAYNLIVELIARRTNVQLQANDVPVMSSWSHRLNLRLDIPCDPPSAMSTHIWASPIEWIIIMMRHSSMPDRWQIVCRWHRVRIKFHCMFCLYGNKVILSYLRESGDIWRKRKHVSGISQLVELVKSVDQQAAMASMNADKMQWLDRLLYILAKK